MDDFGLFSQIKRVIIDGLNSDVFDASFIHRHDDIAAAFTIFYAPCYNP